GAAQIAMIAGPVVAGFIIQVMPGGSPVQSPGRYNSAIVFLFLCDAFTFVVSLVLLLRMSNQGRWYGIPYRSEAVLPLAAEGFGLLWKNLTLLSIVIVVSIVSLLASGPIFVGVPVLAIHRLPESASAYGMLLSAYGGGTLVGTGLGGLLPPLPPR